MIPSIIITSINMLFYEKLFLKSDCTFPPANRSTHQNSHRFAETSLWMLLSDFAFLRSSSRSLWLRWFFLI